MGVGSSRIFVLRFLSLAVRMLPLAVTGSVPILEVSKAIGPRDAKVLFVEEIEESASSFPFEEQTWFQLLDSEIINAKVLLRNLETVIGVSAESFERRMGKVYGSL